MGIVQKLSVALPAESVAMLKSAVESGEYTSTSEVVRDALRLWKARRSALALDTEELRGLWNEGLASGASMDAEIVFERLRGRFTTPDTQ